MVQGIVAGQASFVKSIQHGVITIITGQTSGTGAINSVNTTNSVVICSGRNIAGGSCNNSNMLCYSTLTNATTVTATRHGNTEYTYMAFIVIEFYSNAVKSIQSGSTATTDTINAVVVNKSACFYRGSKTTNTDSSNMKMLDYITLTNSTTVTQQGVDGLTTTYYSVVEFY